MAVQTPPKTGFEKWQEGINKAVGDAKWNAWDCEIQMAVSEYNRHLLGTAGYVPLDWQLIKAMVWVETGANSPEWTSKPMQIGGVTENGKIRTLRPNRSVGGRDLADEMTAAIRQPLQDSTSLDGTGAGALLAQCEQVLLQLQECLDTHFDLSNVGIE